MKKHALGFIYLASGFAALVYEVVWLRLFGLKFGISSLAVGSVLAAFMLGLAWGANFWGRFVEKRRDSLNLLRLYAVQELGVGLYGLILPQLLEVADKLFLQLFISVQPSFYALSLGRFLIALILLFPPTALMGGTLPVLIQYFTRQGEALEKQISYLYGVNILGAMLGCFISGFFLIGSLGVQNTNYLASGINLAIAVLVLLFGTKSVPQYKPSETAVDQPILPQAKAGYWKPLLLLVAAGAGFTSLSYEVLWNRILALMLRNTVYAFCTMLTTFLAGLFIGTMISKRLSRNQSPHQILGLLEMGIGLYALAIIPVFGKMNEIFCFWEIDRGIFGHSWMLFSLGQFALCALILLLPTILMGAVFPLLCKLYLADCNGDNTAPGIGKIYALNTLGAVLGSLAAGFFLIPWLGSQGSILLTAGINVALGLIIIALTWPLRTEWIAIMLVLLSMAVWGANRDITFRQAIETVGEEILARQEDSGALIEVTRNKKNGTRMLVTNRQQQEGDSSWPSVYNQREQVYLPLLLHPQPKKVLGIGLGTGISIAALTHYPLEVAECVELSAGVIQSSRFFAQENADLLHNPRIKIIQADGRNYLRLTPHKYDLIVADLFTSYDAGVGNLYSREHYLQCRERLAPGGIMCQWLPPHQLPGNSLKIIARTFQSVFPHTSLWLTRQAIALIGTPEPLQVDYQRFKQQFVIKDLHDVGLSEPLTFLNDFIMADQQVARYSAGQPINTDDYPLIEFGAPREFYRLVDTSLYDQHVAEIGQFQESILSYVTNWGNEDLSQSLDRNWQAQIHAQKGQELAAQGDYPKALEEFRQALALDKNQIGVRQELEKYYLFQGQELSKSGLWNEALDNYLKAVQIAPRSAPVHLALGQVYQELQQVEKALREFALAAAIDPYGTRR